MYGSRERELIHGLLHCLGGDIAEEEAFFHTLPNFGSLSALLEATSADAVASQLDEGVRITLALIPWLSRYRALERMGDAPPLHYFSQAGRYTCALYIGARYEQASLLCLDESGCLIHCAQFSEGTLRETLFLPRRMVQAALRYGAQSVILCHNHPSGHAEFSEADVSITSQLLIHFASMGIAIHDHILEARGRVRSMRLSSVIEEKTWMSCGSNCVPLSRWMAHPEDIH